MNQRPALLPREAPWGASRLDAGARFIYCRVTEFVCCRRR